MPLDFVGIVTALGALGSGIAAGAGGVVGWRRARRQDDALVLTARDKHLDRLEREVRRLDIELDDERRRGVECERLHRECQRETARQSARLAHLEERLGALEERSDQGRTPLPPPRGTK